MGSAPFERRSRRAAVARGDEPADLVLKNARALSVFTREWLEGDVAVVDGVIAGVGSYSGRQSLELENRYLVPGFIDAHMHFETPRVLPDDPPIAVWPAT